VVVGRDLDFAHAVVFAAVFHTPSGQPALAAENDRIPPRKD
jgi:hypothetical protein